MPTIRLWRALPLLTALSACAWNSSDQKVDDQSGRANGEGWRETSNQLVPRVRVTESILDSQPAVLEAVVNSAGAPYFYSVDWGDRSKPESGQATGGQLRLTHDYDIISTYRVVLEVRAGEAAARIEPPLVTVQDDDAAPPRVEWTLPAPVVRPGEPALVGWQVTDTSGLDKVVVVIVGPTGPLDHFETAQGQYDLTGRGPGVYRVELRVQDADRDRPGDQAGFMLIEIVTVTDDLDADGVLDYVDNCPRRANRDQRDRDHDGLGDVCDPCPTINGRCEEQLPGAAARPGSGPASAALAVAPLFLLGLARRERRRASRLLLLALALVLLPGAALAAPMVSRVRPAATLVGEPVVITGSGFGASQGADGGVTFGGVDAGTALHWTDTRITVEVPVGSLVGGVPTPTPTGSQPVVVRTAAGETSLPVNVRIEVFNQLPVFRQACRCGAPGCSGPCLPDDYCRNEAEGCSFDGVDFGWRDIKDVDFGDIDADGDLDIVDVSSPMAPNPDAFEPGFSPGHCPSIGGAPFNFADRLFANDGFGRFTDITGGADGDYATAGDNPLPLFQSFRTYDADLADLDNDGYLDLIRADRAFCAGAPSHYFKNVDVSGDGVPDTRFEGFALAAQPEEAYWDNVAVGDLEGDGDLDVLISHSANTPNAHALFVNNGSGLLAPYDAATMAPSHDSDDDFHTYIDIAHDMALGDLDGDRDQDIVIGGGNHTNALPDLVLLNRWAELGELFFESIPVPRATEDSATVHVGIPDLNGDGRRDVHFVNDRDSLGPADRLFLNLGSVECGTPADTGCPDGLSASCAGQVVNTRICWRDASLDLPEAVAGVFADGYGADYGDIDADGDLDILVTGIASGGNYLFLNRGFTACATAADCPSGYGCVAGGCRPTSAQTTPKWWSCPTIGSGGSAVPCRDRNGATLTGPDFPAARVDRRNLAVVFGDVDGDVDLDVLWGRLQWGVDWEFWPDAGPLLLVGDNVPYVKRVTVFSGPRIVYRAEWVRNPTSGELDLQPGAFDTAAAFTALRTQDLIIEVEFSEAMAAASLTAVASSDAAAPLGVLPTLTSAQPAGERTIWRGTISNLDILDDGSHDGRYAITLTGTDTTGNQLLAITSRASLDGGELRGAVGEDTIHGFRIGPLAGVIPVTALFMKQGPAAPASPLIDDKALALQAALDDYFGEVSYNEIGFAVTGHGWFQLDQPIASYYMTPQTPLLDLVQEAIDDALTGEVDLSSTAYLLVVTDETAPRDEWSTTGGWPYTVGGTPRLIASGVLNLASPDSHTTHLAGHWLGLVDLFAYPEVLASREFVGPFSHMSDRDREVHVLGWEKWRAGWLDATGTATGKTLTRVEKPPVGAPIDQPHTILPLDSGEDGVKMVAIELADGLHYTAEYRRKVDLDSDLPSAGVVLVKANDLVNQGEGPAILQESDATAGTLDDAPFVLAPPRHLFSDVGSGVSVEVIEMTPAQAEIRLNYEVPSTENDVHVVPPDDRWETIDIWVDAPDLALNFAVNPRDVQDAAERPVIGLLNKVIGRVRNQGPADATNFEVELEILEPWGTGGRWRRLVVETVTLLQGQDNNRSADHLIIADWTPKAGEHTCVRLRVRTVPNDINPANNETQENIHEFSTTPGSPYAPVTTRFQFENPFDEPTPILFRLDGLPPGWSYTLLPERPVPPPHTADTGQLTLQPGDGAPLCSREEITLTAYAPRADTLKRLGGFTMAVELKSPAALTAETRLQCDQGPRFGEDGFVFASCRLETRGCTDPGLPNTQVAVVYTAPDGSTAVRYVTTDAAGCFVDLQPGVAPGLWQVEAVLEEEDCRVGDRTGRTPHFVPPGFGRVRRFGVFTGGNWPLEDLNSYSPSFTFAVQGELALSSNLLLGLQAGYHAFDAEPAAGVDNLGFTNLSFLARWLGGGTIARPFGLVGVGGYHADGAWDAGFAVGAGFELPVTPAVSLASGITAHRVNRDVKDGTHPTWVDAYLGFFVALP